MKNHIVLIFFFLASACCLHAQDKSKLPFSLIPVAEEIPDHRISSINQDLQGFIWISTFNGLYRYDGLHYLEFKNTRQAERKINFNYIEYSWMINGRFLILEGRTGIDILDVVTSKVLYTSPVNQVFIKSFRNKRQYYFHFEDSDLRTYLYTFSMDGTLVPALILIPPELRVDKAACNQKGDIYFFDRVGRLWFGDSNTGDLDVLDSITFRKRRLLYMPMLYCDDHAQLWALDNLMDAYNGIYRFTSDHHFSKIDDLGSTTTIFPDNTAGEFWYFNKKDNMLGKWSLNTQTKQDLVRLPASYKNINTVLKDHQGNLWIGSHYTLGESLILAHPHVSAFHTILSKPIENLEDGNACRALAELPGGDIMIGSMEGIYYWKASTEEVSLQKMTMASPEMEVNNIWKIIPEHNGNRIWFSKEEGGVFEYIVKDHMVKNYFQSGQISDRTLGMCMDHNGILWLGTRSGITWFNSNNLQFEPDDKISAPFFQVSAYNWIQSDENIFWLCSSNGLYQFDSTRHIIKNYRVDTPPFLSSNEVFDIVPDSGINWIATDNGLLKLENEHIDLYTIDQGLAHNTIASLEIDDEGNLWIATFGGLCRLEKKTGNIQNFYMEDGLPQNEFNRLGKLKTKDGRLFFSTQNGVVYFDPSEIRKETSPFPLVLTDFQTYDKDGRRVQKPMGEQNQSNTIRIPAGNKYFQVEFALLNYINAKSNRYSYYLEGLEKTWRPLKTVPAVEYNNLPAGKYVLHIRAVSPSGQFSINTINLKIFVLQHFYRTFWFNMSLIVLIMGFLFLILRARSMQRLKLEKMRSGISRDLHDEVGGVLSGVAMQMELLEYRSPDHLKPFMQRVALSSRNAAIKMRDVIWAVDTSKDHFEDLLDRMKAFTLELLVPLDISYKFVLNEIDPQKILRAELKQNVYLIFKESLNNVIRHSKAKKVEIKLEVKRKILEMSISDNGIGLAPSFDSKGQGLGNMKKRAQMIGGALKITQREEGGTIIFLEAPL